MRFASDLLSADSVVLIFRHPLSRRSRSRWERRGGGRKGGGGGTMAQIVTTRGLDMRIGRSGRVTTRGLVTTRVVTARRDAGPDARGDVDRPQRSAESEARLCPGAPHGRGAEGPARRCGYPRSGPAARGVDTRAVSFHPCLAAPVPRRRGLRGPRSAPRRARAPLSHRCLIVS